MNTDTLPAAPELKSPRPDLYGPIHKALRAFMGQVLQRLGTLDPDDDAERTAAVHEVQVLLGLLRSHLQHENDFVHAALEARRPGTTLPAAQDHRGHLDAIGNLEDEAQALRNARPSHRAVLALRLYRHLAVFVGENLVHMQVEETVHNDALWALYDDEELVGLHDRLVASIPPAEMALVMHWMVAALNDAELAGLYADLQAKAPPPAFEALLEMARTRLDERRWARLARALGRAPVPGLMTL